MSNYYRFCGVCILSIFGSSYIKYSALKLFMFWRPKLSYDFLKCWKGPGYIRTIWMWMTKSFISLFTINWMCLTLFNWSNWHKIFTCTIANNRLINPKHLCGSLNCVWITVQWCYSYTHKLSIQFLSHVKRQTIR